MRACVVLRNRAVTRMGRQEAGAGATLAGALVTGAGGVMERISIDEFGRIELRVATVVSAEAHPGADRLVVLQVDLGEERRQLVAGIRGHYAPEELIGRQIVVVTNLQPAKLRGVDSLGMLLAATDSAGNLVLVSPDKPIAPGAVVR